MSDIDAITALVHEYVYRIDAGDLDGVAALFEHAELGSTRHDRRLRGAREARTLYDRLIIHDDGTPQTMHEISNLTIRVDGASATARCYFTVLQVTGQGLHPVLAGQYLDQFEQLDGEWRFTERIFDPRLFGDLSRHMNRDPS
jgi:hypothetical protein